MDVALRLKALEDRVGDLERGASSNAPKNVNFNRADGKTVMILTANGQFVVDGLPTKDPDKIIQAIKEFLGTPDNKPPGTITSLKPVGDA